MHASGPSQTFVSMVTASVCWLTCAAGGAGEADFSFENLKSLAENHCMDCHSGDEPEAELNLSRFEDLQAVLDHPATWSKVLTRVRAREMPPPDSGYELSDEQVARFSQWIEAMLLRAAERLNPGPAPLRRLNKYEYSATVRDLLGVHVDVGQGLPADGAGGEGFDNAAATLFISPLHAEKYLEAAQVALDYMAKDPPARELIFIAAPGENVSAEEAARAILHRFMERAFRRPIEPEEVDRYLKLYRDAAADEEAFDQAVLYALQGVMISPHFLFRLEQPNDAPEPQPVSDFELATRLSYFLWSSMPDEELTRLAARGALHERTVLREQAIRMLDVEIGNFRRSGFSKARALAENFVGQWLGTRELGREFHPDKHRFGDYDYELEFAMRWEPIYVFEYMLRENRPLLDLLDADYTFVTRDLMNHYGIGRDVDIRGYGQMQYLELPEGVERGGVLTMASVLTVSSYPHRTSPVLRGKWILEKLLDAPPPPPPPDVPELEEQKEGMAGKTLRERLEIHRENSTCAACHDRMDPLGFGLENYDAIGRWRMEDAGQPIDARGELPNGLSFEGPRELKQILLDRKDDFVRMLTKQMLSYALGRGLVESDYAAVEKIVERVRDNEYKTQELILGIVESVPFRYKAGRETPASPADAVEAATGGHGPLPLQNGSRLTGSIP